MSNDAIHAGLALVVVALLGVSLSTPLVTADVTSIAVAPFIPAADYGHIEGVDYVWQEINGFCYWSSVDMALQYIDIPYNLYQFFAASGIGFSAAYIMIEDTQLFLSGSSFRQQQNVPMFCELLGIEHEAHFDSNSEWIQIAEPLWADAGFNIELIDGSEDAFEQMRASVDEGYPVVLWVDPYWLPAVDYFELREYLYPQDPAAPSSGHAIVAIGYNDTAQTIEVMDPGVGAFGERYGYPNDGRWYYTMNYSTLDIAWNTLGYGQVVFKPGAEEVSNLEERIGKLIVERLLGNRTSYAPEMEEIFFASFGEAAFRGLSLDTTKEGIKNYLNQFDESEDRADILRFTGYSHELFMSLQYPSYKGALESLPSVMPSYDLTDVLELGRQAYPHMEALSTNDSLVNLTYAFDGTLLATTYFAIADSYESSGDIDEAVEAYSSEIETLAEHLLAVADSWKSAGDALNAILSNRLVNPPVFVLLLGVTSGLIIVIVIIWRRR
ncbi:MAG: C39 family peptidase [Candidatus Thorarchaeota archaeon]